MLFTADLKSFASYGLDKLAGGIGLSTPPLTPEPTAPKRKRATKVKVEVKELEVETELKFDITVDEESNSLAERVKKRRRVTVKSYVD